jgi:UDP-N-acetylmuramoyl-tripeptide--D-alanyl-D-alanine ligase
MRKPLSVPLALIALALLFGLGSTALLLWAPDVRAATDAAAAAKAAGIDASWVFIGAALATGMSSLGAGFAVARVGTAAVGALAQVNATGRRIAVLGEMLELGDHSEEEHAALGRLVAERGIDVLVVVGDEAAPTAAAARSAGGVEVHEAADAAAAAAIVVPMVRDRDVVLVKGSRAVGLDAVARELVSMPTIDGQIEGQVTE